MSEKLTKKEIEALGLSGYAISEEMDIVWLDDSQEIGRCVYRVNGGMFARYGNVIREDGSIQNGGDIIESHNHSDNEFFEFVKEE